MKIQMQNLPMRMSEAKLLPKASGEEVATRVKTTEEPTTIRE
jgi:hypothetical protein